MTKARIGNKEFDFGWDHTFHNATWNGEKIEIQPSEKKGHFCLKYQNKNFRGEWIAFHSETKIATIKINHTEYNVTINQPIDALLENAENYLRIFSLNKEVGYIIKITF